MQKFADAVHEGNLFQTFIPMPEVEPDWYGWHVKHWGTKWDISEGNFELEEDGLSGNGWFNTAWSPPIAAFEAFQKLGFTIDVLYHECGMGFAGTWEDGDENCVDNYYDLFQEEDWRDEIDHQDLLNLLEAEYDNWVEMNKEEE
jgi:hypothetical protein